MFQHGIYSNKLDFGAGGSSSVLNLVKLLPSAHIAIIPQKRMPVVNPTEISSAYYNKHTEILIVHFRIKKTAYKERAEN